MARAEPLTEEGSPHIAKLKKVVKFEMEDKMVELKKGTIKRASL